jgi:hypothetical protein
VWAAACPSPAYGSGGWGFESLAARHHHRWSAACNGVAGCRRLAGLRPNCDHVGGYFLSDCDHLRPQAPTPAAFLLISTTLAALASCRCSAAASGLDQRTTHDRAQPGSVYPFCSSLSRSRRGRTSSRTTGRLDALTGARPCGGVLRRCASVRNSPQCASPTLPLENPMNASSSSI